MNEDESIPTLDVLEKDTFIVGLAVFEFVIYMPVQHQPTIYSKYLVLISNKAVLPLGPNGRIIIPRLYRRLSIVDDQIRDLLSKHV